MGAVAFEDIEQEELAAHTAAHQSQTEVCQQTSVTWGWILDVCLWSDETKFESFGHIDCAFCEKVGAFTPPNHNS